MNIFKCLNIQCEVYCNVSFQSYNTPELRYFVALPFLVQFNRGFCLAVRVTFVPHKHE